MATDFGSLIADGNFTATLKVLDAAIDATSEQHASTLAKLVQLQVNRGLCQQRLGLNRKALKASGGRSCWDEWARIITRAATWVTLPHAMHK